MCGFVISAQTIKQTTGFRGIGVDTLARGPDRLIVREVLAGELKYHIEFAHLFITQPPSDQPLESEQFVLALNGEIYNYRALAESVGIDTATNNDVQVFFAHIVSYGLEETLKRTNGMYAGILIHKDSGRCIAFTDHVGKKPLLVWNSSSAWHVGTGLDLNYIDESSSGLQVLSPGIHELKLNNGDVRLLSTHSKIPACNSGLSELLRSAVAARIPEDIPFAVALSGGLDSSILTYIIERQLHLAPDYFVLGEQLPEGVISLMAHLGISANRIKLIKPSSFEYPMDWIIDTCRVVKSYNPSIISNGVATMMMSKGVRKAGYRVLLGGEGADEFFCGYQAMYNDKYCPELMRSTLVADIHFTELRRVDLMFSHFAIEVRCPFLDRRVTNYALSKAADQHCNQARKLGKVLLKHAYRDLLPSTIIDADKEPFDITSGLQKEVINILQSPGRSERQVLKVIFDDLMGLPDIFQNSYFCDYPAFDEMIDQRALKYAAN